MKVIKVLLGEIDFTIQGEVFKHPSEILDATRKIKKDAAEQIKDPTSKLNAWVSVYFQEDPFTDFREEGVYENKLKEYVEFIEKLNPGNQLSKRFREAKNKFIKSVKKEKSKDRRFYIGMVFFALLPLAAAGALFWYVYNMPENPLPGKFWEVSSVYYVLLALITTVFVWIGMYEDNDIQLGVGCIGGPILGLIVGVGVYYLFYFVIQQPYVLAGLSVLALGFLYKMMISYAYYTDKSLKADLYNTKDAALSDWEPLQYAFSDETKFESSRNDVFDQYRKMRRGAKFDIFKYSVSGALLFGALLTLLLYHDPDYAYIFEAAEEYTSIGVDFIVNLYNSIAGGETPPAQ